MSRQNYAHLATSYHIPLGENFYALRSDVVGRVLELADIVKYRKPKNANGSRGRYFYERLNRDQRAIQK